MISLEAFADELIKIAADSSEYKKVRIGNDHVYLKRGIPLIGNLPKDPDKAVDKIKQVVKSEQAHESLILGYNNVAVRAKDMPDLRRAGFKPTRLATPLPGEKLLNISYRKGSLHAHKHGPLYMIHEDTHAPLHPQWGYLHRKAIKHAWKEGLPSIIDRFKETHKPLVRKRLEDD